MPTLGWFWGSMWAYIARVFGMGIQTWMWMFWGSLSTPSVLFEELSQSIGPALAMLVGPVKVPEADPEVKDPGKELKFSKYLPYLQAIWAFGTRGLDGISRSPPS